MLYITDVFVRQFCRQHAMSYLSIVFVVSNSWEVAIIVVPVHTEAFLVTTVNCFIQTLFLRSLPVVAQLADLKY